MKQLSDKELDQKIEAFLTRKNVEVFHSQKKQAVTGRIRPHHFSVLKLA